MKIPVSVFGAELEEPVLYVAILLLDIRQPEEAVVLKARLPQLLTYSCVGTRKHMVRDF